MVRLVCPHCEQVSTLADTLGGFTVQCPKCGVPVDVPSGSAPDQAAITADPALPPGELEHAEGITDQPGEPFLTGLRRNLDVRKSVSPWTRRLEWGAILTAVPAILGVVAWLLGGNGAWLTTGYLALVLLIVFTLGALKEWIVSVRHEGFRPQAPLAVLYLWGVLGVWYGVGHLATRGTIYVDNFSDQAVKIELDGRPWLELARSQTLQVSVRPGQHRITVRGADWGEPIQELSVQVEAQGIYLLNAFQAQTYYRGSVSYGRVSMFGGDDRPQPVHDAWLDVTKVDFLFESPPRSIKVKVPKGSAHINVLPETRTYLTRSPPVLP